MQSAQPYTLTLCWLESMNSCQEELAHLIEECSEQIREQNDGVQALLQRGIYHTAKGDKDLAKRDFEKLDTLVEDWRLIWPAYVCRGYLIEQTPQKALFYYEKVFCFFYQTPPVEGNFDRASFEFPSQLFEELFTKISNILQKNFINQENSSLTLRKWVSHPLVQLKHSKKIDALSL